MMRAAALLLALAAPATAGADTIRCTITASCSADYGCSNVEAGSVALLDLAADGATGTITYGGEEMPLARIAQHVTGPVYMAEAEGGSRAFFSLYGDGTLSASTHEINESGISVWLATGTCEAAGS
jgi:hypothetical protein